MPPKKKRVRPPGTRSPKTTRKPVRDDRQRSEFLSVLGHELRNPLALLNHAARLLGDPAVDGATKRDAQGMMGRQLFRLGRLVDDLLDVAGILSGKLALRRARIELSAAILRAAEGVRPQIDARRQRLEIDLPNEPVWLDADAARMRQVFENLLDNASKLSPEGGRIRLGAEAAGRKEVAVRVEDDGDGIAAARLPGLFEFFARDGVGIGLPLTKALVEMHGGSIRVESARAGRGSAFLVRLPILSRGAGTAGDSLEARPAGAPSLRRILVIDDNIDGAQALGLLLQALGHEVRVSFSGPDGLEAAESFGPQVVLLDLGLPGMDGFEVARRLQGRPGMDRVLLVAVSGFGRDEDRERSSAAGFHHHLVKPADLGDLQRILDAGNPFRTADLDARRQVDSRGAHPPEP